LRVQLIRQGVVLECDHCFRVTTWWIAVDIYGYLLLLSPIYKKLAGTAASQPRIAVERGLDTPLDLGNGRVLPETTDAYGKHGY